VRAWTGFNWLRRGSVTVSCELDNKPSGFRKGKEILEKKHGKRVKIASLRTDNRTLDISNTTQEY
jgi:hypothetical protein